MLHGKGFHNRRSPVKASGALSAPGLARTSANNVFPITVDTSTPIDWDLSRGAITGVMERTSDPAFLTGVQTTSNNITGGGGPYNWGFDTDVRTPLYGRWYGYQGATPPPLASRNYSRIIGSGDTTAPTITSSNTITLTSGVASNLSLTANETVTWSITGGANQDQYSISGSTLTCAAQVSSGSYAVQVTATDICGNTTNQTVTATLSIAEFSTAATDKQANMTVSGTPKLTAQGLAGSGSEMNVRTAYTATGKRWWAITPTQSGTDQFSMQMDDGTANFGTAGYIVGISGSTGIALTLNSTNWFLQYSGGYNQSGSSSPHVAGDLYMCEYDTATQSYSFFRIRSGSKIQLGTTVSGIGTFTHAGVMTKNDSTIVANFGSSAAPATPTSGYGAFNA